MAKNVIPNVHYVKIATKHVKIMLRY